MNKMMNALWILPQGIFAGRGICFCNYWCGNVPFLFRQERNQRSRLKEALREGALLKNPPAASPSDWRKCPDFRQSALRKLPDFFRCRCSKIGTFLDTERQSGVGGRGLSGGLETLPYKVVFRRGGFLTRPCGCGNVLFLWLNKKRTKRSQPKGRCEPKRPP